MNFVEEIQTFNGTVCYCILCGIHVDINEKDTHCKDENHAVLHEYETCDTLSVDDKLIMVKSDSLSPSEAEFTAVKDIVLTCEKTLKLVSDLFVRDLVLETKQKDSNAKSGDEEPLTVVGEDNDNECLKSIKEYSGSDEADEKDNKEVDADKENDAQNSNKEKTDNSFNDALIIGERKLRGSMRVGLLGNGLLMAGDVNVRLVVASVDKPTIPMLHKMKEYFDEQLLKVTTDGYETKINENDACIIVVPTNSSVPGVSCTISVTSTLVRRHPFHLYNTNQPPDPEDMLPWKYCDEALQAIRRARWFETKMYLLNHCEPVFRVTRDLCSRDSALMVMDTWILQQLLFKVLSSSSGVQMSASEAIIRFFESISSGALLPDGPGLYDPCERAPTNLCNNLSTQEKEDITFRSQELLRQISQRRLYHVLNIAEENINDRVKKVMGALEAVRLKRNC